MTPGDITVRGGMNLTVEVILCSRFVAECSQ